MFLNSFDNAVKVTDVWILRNGDTCCGIHQGRPFNTISFRIVGNSEISDKYHTEKMVTGSVLFMPKDTEFRLKCRYERFITVHFESEFPFAETFVVIQPENIKEMRELFEMAYHTWALKLPGYYYKTMSVFYKILEKLSTPDGAENRNYSYHSILPAIERMERRFKEPNLHISDLCELVNLSDTQFRRHFITIFGVSPMKYLLKLRMENAAELLQSSTKSVEEIAHDSGFNDAKHFSTVFKSVYKISPLKYRKI